MTNNCSNINDDKLELLLSNLLKIGVIISGIITFIGAILFLFQHGFEISNYHDFKPHPFHLSDLNSFFRSIISFRPESIMELGLLILIATPVLRVFLSFLAYSFQKDYMYIIFSLIVLMVMVIGFLS